MEDKNLIYHFLKDDCSKEELDRLHTWLISDLNEEATDELLSSIWKKTTSDNTNNLDISAISDKIKQAVKSESIDNKPKPQKRSYHISTRRKRRSYSLSIAASVLLITFSIGYFISSDKTASELVDTPVIAQIVKQTSRGHRSSLSLRDGSKVTLNSETKVTYDDNFGLTHRNIYLEGEGFFEVAKNEELPFTVISQNLETRALGTSFNVRDYGDEMNASIALATGVVGVKKTSDSSGWSKLILQPNEQITLNKTSQEWLKSKFSPIKVLSWKENKLYFNEMSLTNIIKTLERWYDVKIDVRGPGIEKLKYEGTGTFERQSLENLLNSLGYTMGFESIINKKQIIIELTN